MLFRKILNNLCTYFRHYSSHSYFTVKEALQKKPVGDKILIQGWVQAVRKHKDLYFVDLVDGTCFERLQIVIQSDSKQHPTYGSSLHVEGSLIASSHKGQEVELIADSWNTYGFCPSDYPFEYRVKYSSEYIRQLPHLRPRTRKFSSVLRIRNAASIATHQFFQNEGFCFIHTPIITQNDCEGAGDVFSVQLKQKQSNPYTSIGTSNCKTESVSSEPKDAVNNIDTEDFFGNPAFLTVSGQLHLEAMACALSRVYNFGPVFRAENSRTRQHASEFHMIEAEIAFLDNIDDMINFVEKCIKYIAKSIMDSCYSELQFIYENDAQQENYLDRIIRESFVVMSYNEAIKILQSKKDELKVPIQWGDDLVSDHKNVLVKYTNNIPVFVIMFPSSIKPFYMKTSNDKKEAFCFDLFAPFGGEICGGSLRENVPENLNNQSILQNSLSWYLDLRKYGAVPHGGFGIGFDRLLQSLLCISNIRDIIPFPRRKNDCKC